MLLVSKLRLTLIGCSLLSLIGAQTSAQVVKIFRDTTYDFSKDSTYRFKPGTVIMNRDTVNRLQANTNMQAAFDANFFQHHLKLNAQKGQLIFTFLGGIQSQANLATYGHQIRLPKGIIDSSTEEWLDDDRPEGVLVLALINPKTTKPVWVAVGYNRFFTRDSQSVIDQLFKEAFTDFPTKGTGISPSNFKKQPIPASTKKKSTTKSTSTKKKS